MSQNEETTITLSMNNADQDQNEQLLFGSTQNPDLLALTLKITPYKSRLEHQALQYWLTRAENCQVISRSFGSFNILGVELPKAAWEYQSVRHGLLAAAAVTNSLEKFANGEADVKDAAVQALKHGSLAIQYLFEETPSPYVTVLVAFVFWFMEAWYGSWARALMHLASATRISREAHARGEVTQAVAWYVQVISEGVPPALKEEKLLSLAGLAEQEKQNSLARLRYGIREVELGNAWISQIENKAKRIRPSDCGLLLIPLQVHQKQMKWLCDRWRKYLLARNMNSTGPAPEISITSTYTKVKEQTDFFLARSANFDLLVLEMRLKMILRSLPLFVAGSNVEMRRDTAMVIPYGFQIQARISQDYPTGDTTRKVESMLPIDTATAVRSKVNQPTAQKDRTIQANR